MALLELPEKVCGGQGIQEPFPRANVRRRNPGGQVEQWEEPGRERDFEGQGRQEEEPSLENVFVGHGIHWEMTSAAKKRRNVPGGQG